MSAVTAAEIPLAVYISNARFSGLITGWLHDAPKFTLTDPGGFGPGSFTVDQRLGFRTDILQPYSRVKYMDKCTGEIVYEGDISHPGRGASEMGPLLEIQVEGGKERLRDWQGARIYCDSDFEGWQRNSNSIGGTDVTATDDKGGSGVDALVLGFSNETHVETNYRCEAVYVRIRESGQKLGRINYRYDGGHTSGSPGWLLRLLATTPSVVARSNILNISGATHSGTFVGPSWDDTCDVCFLQLIWTSGSSNTGTLDNVWASIMELTVVAHLFLKDGTKRTGANHNDYVTAVQVWEDMLGDPLLLANTFDGPGAQLDTGAGIQFKQLAFPDGTNCADIAEEMMKQEAGCTYLVGPSDPVTGKYSLKWIDRPTIVRYEAQVWADDWEGGVQAVEQYDRAVARWKTKTGNIRITVSTQSIPEMAAVGRSRTFFQDLSNVSGDDTPSASTANAAVLEDHRYPKNGGRLTISRPIVDLVTGRTINPWEIQPSNLLRLVGVDPSPDGLNATAPNGSTVCRIVNCENDGASVILDLDSQPWGVFRAIAEARKRIKGPVKKG